jgi:hypothetical protein
MSENSDLGQSIRIEYFLFYFLFVLLHALWPVGLCGFNYIISCFLQGVNVDFPPNKLKQGFGEHAVFVLDHLADAALKSNSFTWKK